MPGTPSGGAGHRAFGGGEEEAAGEFLRCFGRQTKLLREAAGVTRAQSGKRPSPSAPTSGPRPGGGRRDAEVSERRGGRQPTAPLRSSGRPPRLTAARTCGPSSR
nr:hypothetical protein StreXyl84_25730 [Streptomyces sp. Xyl84]